MRHRFQAPFRRVLIFTCWRLGFRQSSFSHITRVPQRAVPYAWARPLLSWHAIVPFRFPVQVSHQTQEPPSKSLPAEPEIQQGASRRSRGMSSGARHRACMIVSARCVPGPQARLAERGRSASPPAVRFRDYCGLMSVVVAQPWPQLCPGLAGAGADVDVAAPIPGC
jgi:hypothetical protein